MEKKGVLSTLRFIFFTVLTLALIFSAVVVTVLNTYKPAVKAYLDGKFIGYFTNEQQFDEVYNDLVAEKQSIDPNVKVYLEREDSGTFVKVGEPIKFATEVSENDEDVSLAIFKVKKTSNDTDNYRLRMWIDETATIDANQIQNYGVKVAIKGEAK